MNMIFCISDLVFLRGPMLLLLVYKIAFHVQPKQVMTSPFELIEVFCIISTIQLCKQLA